MKFDIWGILVKTVETLELPRSLNSMGRHYVDTCVHFFVSVAKYLSEREKNISNRSCRETLNTLYVWYNFSMSDTMFDRDATSIF
jgi:hypothetical protein